MRAAVGPDLDPGGCQCAHLIPIEEELAPVDQRPPNAGSVREQVDQRFNRVLFTQRLYRFDQWIDIVRSRRPVEVCESLQVITHRAGVATKGALLVEAR